MRKLSIAVFVGVVALLAWPVLVAGCDSVCYNTVELTAGQNYDAGDVAVSCNNGDVTVTYTADPGWCLAATHLFVGYDLPSKSAPGKLGLQEEHGCIQEYTYHVDLDSDCTGVKVAAHAEVLAWSVPLGGVVQYRVQFPATDSYFDAYVTYDGMTDYFRAFCVDLSRTINSGQTFDAMLYSTLDPTAPVDHPENLDVANYILNNQDHYMRSFGAGWEEIQGALWKVLDNEYDCPNTGSCNLGSITFDVAKVNHIVADAMIAGDGFMPGADDVIGILVFIPGKQFTVFQITMIEAYLGEETAWGDGRDGLQFGKGWATYFECIIP